MCSDVLGQRSVCPLVKSYRTLSIWASHADTSGVSGPVALRAGESITGMIGAGLASIDRGDSLCDVDSDDSGATQCLSVGQVLSFAANTYNSCR